MKNILITPEGIKTNLKNVKPLEAICEYIWNGFDAGASQIKVYLHTNELGLINMVSVIDNGTGIVYHELPYKFQPFNESKKAGQSSRSNHSLPHGRKGIGRLTFFSFAQMARWDTVYEKGGKKYQYYIDMNKASLNEYDDNGGKEPVETSASVGTKVTFTQLITLSKDEIIDEIHQIIYQNTYSILNNFNPSHSTLNEYIAHELLPRLYQHRDWLRILHSSNIDYNWQLFISKQYLPIIYPHLDEISSQLKISKDFLALFIIKYYEAIISSWLLQDLPMPPEVFGKYFLQLVDIPITDYFDF